uniref:Uncharacterized protein n=1 Tax=Timema monikensis TaxID=170555 RepID=A0A7R9HM32_9NEOP|nr:unnamed protein product [Timema monikensis]
MLVVLSSTAGDGEIEEQRHAGTPTDLRVGTAVALSSVAKYWVLTNLFPGPIPQVSVYGLHPPRPCDGSKPQDGLSQHQQHCLPALPPPPGVNMATDTMSLLPQHPHSQVAGLHMDQGPLDNSDKNKIDKGTCTVERCGDNQRLVAKGNNNGRSRNLPVTSRWCKAALARSLGPFLFLLSNWSSRLQQYHPRLLLVIVLTGGRDRNPEKEENVLQRENRVKTNENKKLFEELIHESLNQKRLVSNRALVVTIHIRPLVLNPTTRNYLDSFRQQAPLSPLSPTRPAYHLKPLATPTTPTRAYQFSPTFVPYTGQGDPRIAKATQANIVPAKQAPVVIKKLFELF